ncbi:MAG: ribonuclease P protein component [Rhodoferax sp.]
MQRLKTRSQFQAVLAGGTISRTARFALHRAQLEARPMEPQTSAASRAPSLALFIIQDVWMGAMVPKRWAKRAVTRNAIKRQIYTVSTDLKSIFPVAAYVVRLRAGFDRKEFLSATSEVLKEAVRLELQQLFAKVGTYTPRAITKASPS